MHFSLIVPVYNEMENIKSTLDQLLQISWEENFEIILIDDGSTQKVSEFIHTDSKKVTLIRHDQNLGYGAALKTGIKIAKYDNIVIIDADGTYPIDHIPILTKIFQERNIDMLIGSRNGCGVSIHFFRRPAKKFISYLANYIAGKQIPDLNSGLRIFRRDVSIKMFNLLPEGFSFTTTITLAMLINGYSVNFTPISYYPRVGKSKIRPLRDTLNFIQLVLNIALYFSPRKVFLLISGLLLGVAFIWALFSKFVLGQLADVSTIVIVMTSIQLAGVGLLAELIVRRTPNAYKKFEQE